MPNESNARLDRIESNLDRLTQLGVQAGERQSVIEHMVEQLGFKLDKQADNIQKIIGAVAADGENIRVLARIAEAHERRIDRLENGPA